MTTLVTGGTGFLGRHLIDRLLERGESVRILARAFDVELANRGVELIEGSLTNAASVREAVDGVSHVYHLAGRVDRTPADAHKMYELHVDGTRRLLDALRDSEVEKIVVASTSGTVGVSQDSEEIANDDSPLVDDRVGQWPYYLSKIYAERVCNRYFEQYGLPIVTMRPSLLLGPGDWRESSTSDVVLFMKQQIPTLMSGGISFVDVRDTADAFVLAMDKAPAGRSYLLGASNMTLSEFFNHLEHITGIPAPWLPIPTEAAVAGSRLLDGAMRLFGRRNPLDPVTVRMAAHYWYIDSSRARNELGWTTRLPEKTIRDTVRWTQKHHPDFTDAEDRVNPPEGFVPQETLDWAKESR